MSTWMANTAKVPEAMMGWESTVIEKPGKDWKPEHLLKLVRSMVQGKQGRFALTFGTGWSPWLEGKRPGDGWTQGHDTVQSMLSDIAGIAFTGIDETLPPFVVQAAAWTKQTFRKSLEGVFSEDEVNRIVEGNPKGGDA